MHSCLNAVAFHDYQGAPSRSSECVTAIIDSVAQRATTRDDLCTIYPSVSKSHIDTSGVIIAVNGDRPGAAVRHSDVENVSAASNDVVIVANGVRMGRHGSGCGRLVDELGM